MNDLSIAVGFKQSHVKLKEELGNEIIGQLVHLAGITDTVVTERCSNKPYEM